MNTLLNAFSGARIWRKLIEGKDSTLLLIIPEYECSILEALINVLPEYLANNRTSFSSVNIVCSDVSIQAHWKVLQPNEASILINATQMDALMNFIALTYKQYGVTLRKNVKVISSKHLYGGQLQVIMEGNVLPLQTMVLDKMLLGE